MKYFWRSSGPIFPPRGILTAKGKILNWLKEIDSQRSLRSQNKRRIIARKQMTRANHRDFFQLTFSLFSLNATYPCLNFHRWLPCYNFYLIIKCISGSLEVYKSSFSSVYHVFDILKKQNCSEKKKSRTCLHWFLN